MNSIKLEWKRGDWAAYFGLMTNNLTNLLTMMGLLIFVVGIPTEIVYGRIAPAFGLAVLVASVCYAWFGLQMAKHTGRNDVTALPSGPSAPSIFTVTFLVLMPVYQQTKDANFAIQIALVWCFVEALILVGGSFLGETIRKMIPRTVLLSCLSGLGLLLLAMNPMLQAFEAPTVSFIVLLLIFINWFGKKPIFARIPTGLLLLIAGTARKPLKRRCLPLASTRRKFMSTASCKVCRTHCRIWLLLFLWAWRTTFLTLRTLKVRTRRGMSTTPVRS